MADHAIEEEIEIENNMEKEKLDDEAKKTPQNHLRRRRS